MQLLLFDQKQGGVIGAAIICYDDLIIGVILGEPLWKVLFQFCLGISARDNDAYAGGVAVDGLRFSSLDFEEIAKEKDEKKYHRQGHYNGEGNIDAFKGQLLYICV